MLRASIIFFVLGIVSMFLGMNSIGGLSIDIGKILLFVFLILSVLSFFLGRRKGTSLAVAFLALVAGSSVVSLRAHAEDSISESAKEVSGDTVRGAKKAVRATKDSACKLVNGKTECALQKAKHTIQNGADNVEDAID